MQSLRIIQFKCYQEVLLSLNRLTVMAGTNGAGKSAAIQALLFLRHTWETNLKEPSTIREIEAHHLPMTALQYFDLGLNGAFGMTLGNSFSVLNLNAPKSEFSIALSDDGGFEFSAEYQVSDLYAELTATVTKLHISRGGDNPIAQKEFHYLNAERWGPRVNQELKPLPFPQVGWRGEWTAGTLAQLGSQFEVQESRLHSRQRIKTLEPQVNAWIEDIMDGIRIKVVASPETLSAQILIENSYTRGNPVLATNIGFGISYVLPIIVAGLLASANSFLIVENPEAHLHPAAQSKIGRFLGMVAAAGVNVIVETHSDHVVNGIQIAVAEQILPNDLATINFFSQDENQQQPNIDALAISPKGDLSRWPRGFFDQTQIDFLTLTQLKRNG
jgi:predicted ATPase